MRFLNFLKKTMASSIAFLLVGTIGYAQTTNNSCPPKPCCPEMPKTNLMPAYNAPAAVDLQCSWDVWANGSFIYWQPSGENLEVGVADHETSVTTPSNPVNGDVVNMSFGYKPGFKVGLGATFSNDDWDVYSEYTYLRSKDTTSSSGYTPGQIRSLWISPAILLDEDADITAFVDGSATWKANFDFVDASVGRWYYCGKKLTMHPFFGLRGAFIRQSYNTAFTTALDITHRTRDLVHSWAVGPRAGVATNWNVGKGFRFYGNGSTDILYSSYKVGSKQSGATAATASVTELTVSQDDLNLLKSHIDLELGMGWSTDFDCNKWQFDLSAGYDFQIFFDQIMFRRWLDDVDPVKSLASSGNLFLQGLTVSAKLDF